MNVAVVLALAAGLGAPVATLPGSRPVECNLATGSGGANLWERVKVPNLARYCDLLASASAKLTSGSKMLAEVVRLAEEADRLVPGRAAPLVIKGRALGDLGRDAEALGVLRAALARDDRVLDDPAALLAWARALAAVGDLQGASQAFRTLLPRVDVLPLPDRGAAYVAAGVLLLAMGPDSVADAVAVLRQARRDSPDILRSASSFLLALALDRGGAGAEAAAVVAEEGAQGAADVLSDARVLRVLGKRTEPEGKAALALALEVGKQAAAAHVVWQAYLDSGAAGGVWAEHARGHLGGAGRRGHDAHVEATGGR
jgi:tetratricopeptide (TPR) repeat protein